MAKVPLVILQDIVKTYAIGGLCTEILKKVSLTIYQGEFLAIVGASGSGKSTLMNIIGLLDHGDFGDYWLNGRNIRTFSEEELAKVRNRDIGFVFQQFHLLPRHNAKQNVLLPLTYREHLPAAEMEARADLALQRVGMQAFKSHLPTQLSGGQQQRIAIARALVTEPKIILADEPTGSLDSHTGNDIMQLFLELHAEGRTILMITHDANLAAKVERQIIMQDGRLNA